MGAWRLCPISWRLQRTGLIAMTVLGVLFAVAQPAGYVQIAPTPEERLAFARQTQVLATQMSYMLPLPRELDTLAGYLTWRIFGSLPIFFGFWAVVSASGAVRGDEERGLIEQWLAAGVARGEYLVARLTMFAAVSAIATGATGATLGVAALATGEALPALDLTAQTGALWAVTVACFGLVLLLSQLMGSRRGAAGLGGATLIALLLLNGVSRTNDSLATVRWLSPLAYYDESAPLLAGGTFSLSATLVLFGIALVSTALATLLFVRRDLHDTPFGSARVLGPPVYTPSTNVLLRTPALAALYEQRAGLTLWLLGVSAMTWLFGSLARQIVDLMRETTAFRMLLESMTAAGGNPYEGFLGASSFGTLSLLLALFATTQVGRWAAEDADGRLEMLLAATLPRWRVVLERALSLAFACVLIGLVAAASVTLSGVTLGLDLRAGRVFGAGLMLVPLGTAFGAIGAILIGWAPRAAVITLSAIAVSSYLIQQLGVLFEWPEWLLNFSFFQLYGLPLTAGVSWSGLLGLLGITLAGFALAILAMRYRDIGR